MLKVDWCSHKAAKYAVERWHYSKSLPVSKLVKIGAWENNTFIGAVLFSRGANRNMLKSYGLQQTEGCELTRVALNSHKAEVSRIISIAIKMLKKSFPKLRLIVSYSDTEQGHHGGIYQASNFIYDGAYTQSSKATKNGRIAHKRTFNAAGIKGYTMLPAMPKHRYLMPLDKQMRKQIEPLSRPYPKRGLIEGQQIPSAEGGASPTSTLHTQVQA